MAFPHLRQEAVVSLRSMLACPSCTIPQHQEAQTFYEGSRNLFQENNGPSRSTRMKAALNIISKSESNDMTKSPLNNTWEPEDSHASVKPKIAAPSHMTRDDKMTRAKTHTIAELSAPTKHCAGWRFRNYRKRPSVAPNCHNGRVVGVATSEFGQNPCLRISSKPRQECCNQSQAVTLDNTSRLWLETHSVVQWLGWVLTSIP